MKSVVINAAWGSWYPKGQKRMVESLRDHGYNGDVLTWTNEVINPHHDRNSPYTMKAAALMEAIKKDYTHVLWLDCSVIAIKDITPFFDLISPVYFWRSGWNLAQSSADSDLKFACLTRDEAENMYECASGIFGLEVNDPKVKVLTYGFVMANASGVCSTSRFHDNQSKDPRFKFARQDQTALTMAFHKSGFTNDQMHEQGIHCSFPQESYKDSVYFIIKGM